ncbi:MAG: precorrin-6y C5,15-methyltransferase (decarboxylating) subunit CbiE [Cenarchaeum sp. SB0661_bin_35]|nr:precorrin-6y C5,15-methyltransferase (decarboxylating) subunit CbiE [Cenarchaeum sp. SB0667_bin_13]MXZ94159.1 precorrin-6y C5,15-methyltransferase (decarboxylating) subunit CbiE [Cenarchaeum sp. SB0666_bin_15]MYC79016.1 precorrin-6y C5,15-methyltransferase (decarboxylating) subunit CbiE [Cenarchaeum sp. SB0661_bin_35]MYD58093.1 precorrin-6y C5,15-methyltransferase (decarboxylating) subunit CbiE [Cenarchaeum sp. SB0678_bin_8]MYJ27482.1 precorrin-6y C5,15-methyltransferase (decarboxylating) su
MVKVYAVGVGPGSPQYVTQIVIDIIQSADVVVGYDYTLNTIEQFLAGKKVYRITMNNQEDTYQRLANNLGDEILVIPFTGDVSFSESEVIDRLVQIFGDITLAPGISSTQVAACRAQVPTDKCQIISMHVTGDIEDKKHRMVQALKDKLSVILVPRPWPSRPDLQFMPPDISEYLRNEGFDTKHQRVFVYEYLTMPTEKVFEGSMAELIGKEFSDMAVMVIDQNKPDSYMNYAWQWTKAE